MTIVLHKDINSKEYIKELAKAVVRPNEFEILQAAARILREQAEECADITPLRTKIFGNDDGLEYLISEYLLSETPESLEKLLSLIKINVVAHYRDIVCEGVADEKFLQKLEKRQTDFSDTPENHFQDDFRKRSEELSKL